MANQHIEINQGMRLGSKLFSFVSSLRAVHDNGMSLKDIADQVAAGGDWEAFQSEFGIPAGQGDVVYNLLLGAVGALDNTAIIQFLDRLG